MTAYNRAHQLNIDNQSPPDADERAADLHAKYLADPDKCSEADAWIEGTLNYDGIEADLAELHACDPSRLIGSDVLARFYRRAKEAYSARSARLLEMAEAEIAAQDERDANDAAEARSFRMEDAA